MTVPHQPFPLILQMRNLRDPQSNPRRALKVPVLKYVLSSLDDGVSGRPQILDDATMPMSNITNTEIRLIETTWGCRFGRKEGFRFHMHSQSKV